MGKTKTAQEKRDEQEVYDKSIALFGECCAFCGNPTIHRHHIRYGASGRKTYMGNIIPLCERHHREVHSNKKKWQPILIEMIDKKLEEVNE